jgi:uncharacterized C2H2 Zn-finger protein
MTFTCEKCNQIFKFNSLYIKHINKKKPCINIIQNECKNYICDKCGKLFKKKYDLNNHLNKKFSCVPNLLNEKEILNNKIKELEEKIKKLEIINIKYNDLQNENIYLKKENEKIYELYNNLLNKCVNNNTSNIITNNTTNNNNITINLTNFGCENINKLTKEEQLNILKYSNQSLTSLIQYLHINDRLPEYKNICIKNLRSNGGFIFENNKWIHLNFDIFLFHIFNKKITNLNRIIYNNDDFNNIYLNNIKQLIDNYDEDNGAFIKKYKNDIINVLYNNTKKYKLN